MPTKSTTINIYALWKNSEDHIAQTLFQFDNLLKLENFKFNLFFFTNDNKDNTVGILQEWKSNYPALTIEITNETLGAPSFGSVTSNIRTSLLAFFRNKCKKMGEGHPSDYSLVVDTDLQWQNGDFLALYDFINGNYACVGALGSTVQNIQDFVFNRSFATFYDIFPLRDKEGSSCMYFADSPFPIKSDNDDFREGKPVRVLAGFGGLGLYKSHEYNHCFYYGEVTSEHVSLSAQLNNFGNLYVIPSCRPITTIDLTTINLDACARIGKEAFQKFTIGNKLREWGGKDTYEFQLSMTPKGNASVGQ